MIFKNKTVFFRADASLQIGTGHIMRCLTLADALREHGAKIYFLCRRFSGDMVDYIRQKSYEVMVLTHDQEYDISAIGTRLPQAVDWLIVDHYILDIRWETLWRPYVKRIMVIDDLADRFHDCDILLDQNFYLDMETRYNCLVSAKCLKLLGPQYALLRKEFFIARQNLRERSGIVNRLLLFFGGSDPTCETMRALEAVAMLKHPEITVDVVMGQANPQAKNIETICNKLQNVVFHYQVDNMAELMAQADLSVGAGGTATWERCFLGLPSLVIVVADNQAGVTEAVATTGAIINLGYHTDVTVKSLCKAMEEIMFQPFLLHRLSEKAFQLMGTHSVNGADLVVAMMEDVYAGT